MSRQMLSLSSLVHGDEEDDYIWGEADNAECYTQADNLYPPPSLPPKQNLPFPSLPFLSQTQK